MQAVLNAYYARDVEALQREVVLLLARAKRASTPPVQVAVVIDRGAGLRAGPCRRIK